MDLVVGLAGMHSVEIADAVYAEPHRLPVKDELLLAYLKRALCDQRIACAPVMAITGEQPHPVAVALNDQAVAVMLVS